MQEKQPFRWLDLHWVVWYRVFDESVSVLGHWNGTVLVCSDQGLLQILNHDVEDCQWIRVDAVHFFHDSV